MREIKFRAKESSTEKWWVGSLNPQAGEINLPVFFANLYSSNNFDIETLGEYTGLKDKNGKEIYEGDIVKYNQFVGEVVWDFSGLMLKVNNIIYAIWRGCEVIGNIYENEDLIK